MVNKILGLIIGAIFAVISLFSSVSVADSYQAINTFSVHTKVIASDPGGFHNFPTADFSLEWSAFLHSEIKYLTKNNLEQPSISVPRRYQPRAKIILIPNYPIHKYVAPVQSSPNGVNWDKLAQCESGGNWAANTGNSYEGGLQFTQSTWQAYGGSGSPAGASRNDQIAVATRVLQIQGKTAWPTSASRGAACGF